MPRLFTSVCRTTTPTETARSAAVIAAAAAAETRLLTPGEREPHRAGTGRTEPGD